MNGFDVVSATVAPSGAKATALAIVQPKLSAWKVTKEDTSSKVKLPRSGNAAGFPTFRLPC